MRRFLPSALIVVVLSGVLAAVALTLPGERVRATAAYLIAAGALGLVLALLELRRRRARRSAFEAALAGRGRGPARVRPLDRMEHDVAQALRNPVDLHRRLRPVLREIATQRLATGHGVDLDRRGDSARALLGEEVWELVRPARPEPDELAGRRLDAAGLDRVLGVLEHL